MWHSCITILSLPLPIIETLYLVLFSQRLLHLWVKPSLHLTPLFLCILDVGYLYIYSDTGSFIWFFTLAKFLLNPQAFSAGADPRSRWTVWMVSHLWGLWPLPPLAPCVVPNYSWIPFNKRQAGRQASRHHLPETPLPTLLLPSPSSSSQEEKI